MPLPFGYEGVWAFSGIRTRRWACRACSAGRRNWCSRPSEETDEVTPAPVGTSVVRSLYNRVNVVGRRRSRNCRAVVACRVCSAGRERNWWRARASESAGKIQRDRVNGARGFWKRDLNPLLSEYKSDALPNELFQSACGLCSAGHAESHAATQTGTSSQCDVKTSQKRKGAATQACTSSRCAARGEASDARKIARTPEC